MKPISTSGVVLACVLFAALGCGGSVPLAAPDGGGGTTGSAGHAGGGAGVSGTAGTNGAPDGAAGATPLPAICSGNPRGGVEVADEHRPTALACQPSTRSPSPPDGGAPSCTTNADCANDAGSAFSTCLAGRCSFDQCLTDDDCSGGVCLCANGYYGGNAAFHPNVCVPASCHVDTDCGTGGYCSPSRGYCGSVSTYHCHAKRDTCVDATKDCAGCGNACVFSPEVDAFVCGSSLCAG